MMERPLLPLGGTSLMVALDLESGEVIWETPNELGWQMSHSSIMPWEFEGVKDVCLQCLWRGLRSGSRWPECRRNPLGNQLHGITRWWLLHPFVCPMERYS